MADVTYRTLEVEGFLTIKRVRRFRVPFHVSDDDFQEAIDDGQIEVDCHGTHDVEWTDVDSQWEITPQGYGFSFYDKGDDLGGEDVDGIFPAQKTVRLEITAPAPTVYTINVPADTNLEELQHLISKSLSYSAPLDLLLPTMETDGPLPDIFPSSTRVDLNEVDHDESEYDATALIEKMRAKNATG